MQELPEPLTEGARSVSYGSVSSEWSWTGAGHRRLAKSPTIIGDKRRDRPDFLRHEFQDLRRGHITVSPGSPCQFRDTKFRLLRSEPSALLTFATMLKLRTFSVDCPVRQQRATPFAAPDFDFRRMRGACGGLQQDRAKHGGFGKDAGPSQRLERAPNAQRCFSTARKVHEQQANPARSSRSKISQTLPRRTSAICRTASAVLPMRRWHACCTPNRSAWLQIHPAARSPTGNMILCTTSSSP